MSSRVADFREMLHGLMPPGWLFDTSATSDISLALEVFAKELERIEAQGEFILKDLNPLVTTLFLLDWERVLGLPECDNPLGTTAERRAHVIAKLTEPRNLAASTIEAVCLLSGLDVTVTDSATVDHQFDVDLASYTIIPFTTGSSTAGDRLGTWGDVGLICLLDRLKPAHTTYVLTTPP